MTTEVNTGSNCIPLSVARTEQTFTFQELKKLAARASTLEERFSGQFVPKSCKKNMQLAKSNYEAWVKSASGGSPLSVSNIFADRDIGYAKAETLFGEVELAEGCSLPAWIDLFSQLSAVLENKSHSFEAHLRTSRKMCAPEQIFYPFVERARHIRDSRAKETWLINLTPQAFSDLDQALIELITDCCTKAVTKTNDSSCFASSNISIFPTADLKFSQIEENNRQPTALHIIKEEGLREFLWNRPVLARLITTMAAQWHATTLQFLERLNNDLETKVCSLLKNNTSGKVQSIEHGLSEIYDEGKSIYKLTFENGLSIGYKPKDLRIDQAWSTVIEWLEKHGAPKSAGVPKTQVCNGYGWVEWVQPAPCNTRSEAEEFFHRSGATLCLIRLFSGNDFHQGNIIASGTEPIPLDLETILQAQPKNNTGARGAEKAFENASEKIENSVLSTGYLPSWYGTPSGNALRLGGLETTEKFFTMKEGFTDPAQRATDKSNLFYNIPFLNRRLLDVRNYEEFLIAGYETMFEFLMKFGPEFCSAEGPLNSFQKVTFRSILRPTHVYTFLMERALNPRNLGNGAIWSAYFDTLYLSESAVQNFNTTREFRQYERTSLSTFNIPIFSGSPDSASLTFGDQHVIKNFFCCPCLEQIKSRLRKLDPTLLEQDRLMIQQSIGVTRSEEPVVSTAFQNYSPIAPSSTEVLIEAVKKLEAEINKSALKAGGGATWLGMVPVTHDERKLQFGIFPPSLLCGTLGIGLLQAALYKISGEEIYRTHATETTAIILERANDIVEVYRLGRSMSLGLGNGLGGIIYALTLLSDMLEDSRYLSFAQVFAQTITPSTIASSKDFGLMSGVAGTMIGLQAFYHRYPSPEIAHKIRDCGRHLLENSTISLNGRKAWKSSNWSMPLTGLMHGASGISLALSRAAQIFNLPQFNEAAIEGIEYESALLNEYGGWPDLRDVKDLVTMSSAPCLPGYSNGTAGIGLARLEFEELNKPFISYSNDIEHAVELLSGQPLLNTDDLSSGNLGILFFLNQAARQTSDSELEEQVLVQVSKILEAATENKSFQWRVGIDADNPGFFNGAAGVGMALLHIAVPDRIPDTLSFRHTCLKTG